MVYGIIKNNKHSYKDFGATIASKSISIPKKIKIKQKVPFMNGEYDFSNIYGDQAYDERLLKYTFNIIGENKIDMNIKLTQILDWLMEGSKGQLYDDAIPGYYFIAECEDTSFDENGKIGTLTANFSAYPFKISNNMEGNDIWDNFNFELDYAIETKFNVNGSLSTDLYNSSIINKTPEVICSSKFEIIKNGITYNFAPGSYKDYRFILNKGNNHMIIKGTGTIEFKFYKEVI
ncbi:MAG: phage tail domain-containing protein [Clostridium sp.]